MKKELTLWLKATGIFVFILLLLFIALWIITSHKTNFAIRIFLILIVIWKIKTDIE
jgi:hypothetical protein